MEYRPPPGVYPREGRDLADAAAGAAHFVNFGFAEGRGEGSFDGLQYIASNADLIQAFGANRDAGSLHFINHGLAEGRMPDDFDAAQHLANYPDLRTAFGTDHEAATIHFITFGFYEGRVDDMLA